MDVPKLWGRDNGGLDSILYTKECIYGGYIHRDPRLIGVLSCKAFSILSAHSVLSLAHLETTEKMTVDFAMHRYLIGFAVHMQIHSSTLHTQFCMLCLTYRVTVMKDRETRQSKGVAFVLFLDRQEAHAAVSAMHNKEVTTAKQQLQQFNNSVWLLQLFGRTLKCSIAKDNGRTPEFIRRKTYTDKSRCYECGVRSLSAFSESSEGDNAVLVVCLCRNQGISVISVLKMRLETGSCLRRN